MIHFDPMRKIVRVFLVLLVTLSLLGGALFAIGYFRNKGAGIMVETTPASTVFINGEQVGRSPYEAVRAPGEVVIKLLPDSFEKPLVPYETKVTLTSDVQTVVRREFGETEDLSSGVIVSFEKVGGKETSVSVISTPDSASVTLDGSVRGFTPYKTTSLSPKDYQLVVSASGFKEISLPIHAQEGYKLTVVSKLVPSGEVEAEKTQVEEKPVEEPKVQEVEILDTGTGFLRVRAGPSVTEAEVGRVVPGKKFVLIEKDEKSGWFKIEFEKDKQGWVTNQFTKLVEGST